MKIYFEVKEKTIIKESKDVYRYLEEFKDEDREYFIIIGLNTKNRVLYRDITHIGTIDQTIIHPREVFKRAITMSCKSIIIAHNHPSGETDESPEDIKITKRLKDAGEILGIKVLDHIIIGKDNYKSIIN